MNIPIKNRNRMTGRVIAFALCLILTGSMATIPAFADDTFVVIGGTQATNSGIYSGYNVVGSNFSGNTMTQTAGVVIGSDNLTGSIPANNNSQQTVVVNNNSETITVVSDGVTTNTVMVSNAANNSMTGTTTGAVLSNGTVQVVATSDAGSTVVASACGLRLLRRPMLSVRRTASTPSAIMMTCRLRQTPVPRRVQGNLTMCVRMAVRPILLLRLIITLRARI